MKRRIYKNIAEENFCKFIEKKGFHPTKRGWPDFLCFDYKNSKVIVVEVKDTRTHPLKKEQYFTMFLLSSYGLPCFRWDNQTKRLQKINTFTKSELT